MIVLEKTDSAGREIYMNPIYYVIYSQHPELTVQL